MTEKRFKSEDNCCGYYTEIDKQKELDLSIPNPKKNLTIEELVDLLNEIVDENEQLKTFLEALREELSLANRDNDVLEKENEQLKQTIINLIENGLNELFGDKYRIIEDIGDVE